jgi:hypothetical protein
LLGRLAHFHDHVDSLRQIGRRFRDRHANLFVVIIGKADARAGPRFDEQLMTKFCEMRR